MPRRATTAGDDKPVLPEIGPPRMVGRDREIGQIAAALARPPAVVLVEGEAGIGKSRLVQESLAAQAARGHRVLVAACPPFRQPFTLGPVVDALRQAAEDVAGLRLSALAGALRPLFPEWAGGLPPAPEPLEDATAARHRLFRALAELLGRLGVGLLVVEDVHWADEATVEFLLFLAARPPQRVSLLMTCRPDEIPDGSLLRRLTSRLPAGTACARIGLGPLDVSQTAGLVSSMLAGEQVSGEFAAFLHERTDGLPLAVEESVRLLCDSGQLIRHGGQWERRSLAELAVPPTVRDSVLERVQRLSLAGRQVLEAAAVLADPAGEPVLAAVTGLSAGRARRGLAEALGCGLLREDAPGVAGFGHVLAARAVYEAIPAPGRRRLHMRSAWALEESSPLALTQLARHFRGAGEAGEWCRYAEQAADLALAVGDDKTAAALLHDLVTRAVLPAAVVVRLTRKIPLFGLTRFPLLRDLACALRPVLDSASLTPAEAAEGRGQLGRILLAAQEFSEGVAELEQAIPGLAHRPAEAARAMVRLGWPDRTLWPAAVDRQWLDRAAATVQASSIPSGDRMEITVNRATALLQLGEESGWAVAAAIPEAATIPQEAEHIVRSCMNIGAAAVWWGRYDEARRRLAAGLELAGRHKYPRLRQGILVNLAHLDWCTGVWSGLAERTAALTDPDDADPLDRLEAMLLAALLDSATGARTVEGRLRQVLEEATSLGGLALPLEPAAVLARLELAGGQAENALAVTDAPMRVVTGKGVWLWATEIAPVRVQVLAAVGRDKEAVKLVRAFARGLRGRDAPAPRAALVTCRAVLAEGMGDAARAAALFARAAAAWQALPRPYDALLAREARARCLLVTGQTEAGLTELGDVFDSLAALGARGDAVRVMRILSEHGVRISRPWWGGRGFGSELSPREREVVALVATGRSNREIAQSLCRSPKTVDAQLTSAMRKLGVSSRTALAVRTVQVEDGMPAGVEPVSGPGKSN